MGTDLSYKLKWLILICVFLIEFCLKCIRDHARLKACTDILACSLVTSNTALAESSLKDADCRARVALQARSSTARRVLHAAGWWQVPTAINHHLCIQ